MPEGLEQTRPDAPKNVPHVSVPPGAIPAHQWEWRKNFRVWQANRKVFLYPESYLDPDLLDIKTPLFEDLEDDLLQQKITMDSASDAYLRYLTQFAELAHLRIAGSCYHAETGTYYFFGCTHQDPPVSTGAAGTGPPGPRGARSTWPSARPRCPRNSTWGACTCSGWTPNARTRRPSRTGIHSSSTTK